MRFAAISLALLLSPLSALAMLAVKSSSYKNGVLTVNLMCYSDAPPSYNVELVSATGNTLIIQSGVVPVNGTNTYDIPSTAAQNPGTYKVSLVSAADPSVVYTTSKPFTVAATDFSSTVSGSATASSGSATQAYTTVTESNGSVSIYAIGASTVTATNSAFTSTSVMTSGSVTTTVVSTGTITPPAGTSTLTNGNGAATATVVTTTKSGAMVGAKAPTVAALLCAVAFAAFMI
ncbi:hypothetical protein FRB94_011580 [Tulasnella sp. JGI-2019a]|nr:hypothetical protein FRB93_000660 [Tulasnella sp. JGI-2019a]KAG9009724.1 hypothetical protein FRB94_011580 [Tulasnella sp. JGI-2019a]KAG9034196.1 hypothetical protein FRB95_013716 [Tulasnella sp. JGI-2019a]